MIKIMRGNEQINYSTSVYPGGEVYVKIESSDLWLFESKILIYALVKNSDDIFRVLLITDALRRMGAKKIHLNIPYLPYARQDRVCAHGEPLSLKVMCDLINSQNYESVRVADAHSYTSLALLDRCTDWCQAEFRDPVLLNSVMVAPDAGAIKRLEKFGGPFIRADKKRSDANWECIVYSDHIGDKNFMIVDDICDGGRTFIELAKKLRQLTNGQVNLYVTHGIFSFGMGVFKGLIDKIYCAYPWKHEDIFEKEGYFDVNGRT